MSYNPNSITSSEEQMTHTPSTPSRVIPERLIPALIPALVVGALLTAIISVSLSACAPQDACVNLVELCPSTDRELCTAILAEQDQEVIDCVYYAVTCEGAHDCLSFDERASP